MKVVVAMDSFKGCLSSAEANGAVVEGITKAFPDAEIIQVPVSDGGEGFLEAIHSVVGGSLIEVVVRDPLMRPIKANYLLKEKTAVIEIAQAAVLHYCQRKNATRWWLQAMERGSWLQMPSGEEQSISSSVLEEVLQVMPVSVC